MEKIYRFGGVFLPSPSPSFLTSAVRHVGSLHTTIPHRARRRL